MCYSRTRGQSDGKIFDSCSSNLKRKLSIHTSSFKKHLLDTHVRTEILQFQPKMAAVTIVSYITVHIKNLKVPDDFENVSKLPSAGRIHMSNIFEDLRG